VYQKLYKSQPFNGEECLFCKLAGGQDNSSFWLSNCS